MSSRGKFNERSGETIPNSGGFTNLVTAFDPYFNALAANVTVAAVNTADLCTVSIPVLSQANRVQCFASWSVALVGGAAGAPAVANLWLEVDAVVKVSAEIRTVGADVVFIQGAHNWSQVVTAAAHTIKTRVTCSVGTFLCRPVAEPTREFFNLTVNVLNVGV